MFCCVFIRVKLVIRMLAKSEVCPEADLPPNGGGLAEERSSCHAGGLLGQVPGCGFGELGADRRTWTCLNMGLLNIGVQSRYAPKRAPKVDNPCGSTWKHIHI